VLSVIERVCVYDVATKHSLCVDDELLTRARSSDAINKPTQILASTNIHSEPLGVELCVCCMRGGGMKGAG
jgi:hypothetical protein